MSYYTCALIIKTTGNDSDYVFTLRKLYGKPGFYIGLIGPTILIFGAITVYFVVIVQSIYPLLYFLLTKLLKLDLSYRDPNLSDPHYFDFSQFSSSYIAILMFGLLVPLCLKKDLSVFIKLSSIGVVCVITLILFVIGYGLFSLHNTHFDIVSSPSAAPVGDADTQIILLFNTQFSNLAGCLCAGYFIH